jgi:CMP-N-acetylneuraminic acid synthetase
MKFFIPIKNDSVRIPKKNFITLGTVPLWQHLLFELRHEDVYIDTDSTKILDGCYSRSNVTCYERKQEHIDMENDEKCIDSPILLMIERFLDEYVVDIDEIIVNTHVTSPFVKFDTIRRASEKLAGQNDSVLSCTVHKEFAYYFDGTPINFDPTFVARTQNLNPIIMGNGAFFIFTKRTFKKYKNRVGISPFFYNLSNFRESIEIDTPEDYEIAKRFI